MAIKMIVCDMDGTLLNSYNEISPKTKDILLELQATGIKIVLASGRGYRRLLPDALNLDLDKNNGYLIDVNGTSIYDVQNNQRKRLAMILAKDIDKINRYFSQFNVEIQYSQDDTIYTYLPEAIYEIKRNIRNEMALPEDYPWTGGMYSWFTDTRDGYPNQIMIRNLIDSPSQCNKIMITQEPHYMNFLRRSIDLSTISKEYEFVFSDSRKIEITNKGTNKGAALNILLDSLNIKNDEVIIFGDSENDISMFKDKKNTVAMENSLKIAKEKANYITDDHNSDGIYNSLMKFKKAAII